MQLDQENKWEVNIRKKKMTLLLKEDEKLSILRDSIGWPVSGLT